MMLQEAEKYFTLAAGMLRKHHPDDAMTGHALNALGMLRLNQDRVKEALPFLSKAHSIFSQTYGPESENTAAIEEVLKVLKKATPAAKSARAAVTRSQQATEPAKPAAKPKAEKEVKSGKTDAKEKK